MRKSSHSVSDLTYHIILVTKYRKPLLTGAIETQVLEECRRNIEHFGGKVLEIEADADHVHILAELSPRYSVVQVVNTLKGVSSRIVRRDHGQEIAKHLSGVSFWSPSYYVATTGGVTIEKIRQYVESQKEPEHRAKRKHR